MLDYQFFSSKKKFKTIGFDNNKIRVKNLNNLKDTNLEFKKTDLKLEKKSLYTNKKQYLKNVIFILLLCPHL